MLAKGFRKIHDENLGITDPGFTEYGISTFFGIAFFHSLFRTLIQGADYFNEAICEEIEGRESVNDTKTDTSYSSDASSDNQRFFNHIISHYSHVFFSLRIEPMQAEDVADDEETASDEGHGLFDPSVIDPLINESKYDYLEQKSISQEKAAIAPSKVTKTVKIWTT